MQQENSEAPSPRGTPQPRPRLWLTATWKRLDTPAKLGMLVSAILLLFVFATFRITANRPTETSSVPVVEVNGNAAAPPAVATPSPAAPAFPPAVASPAPTPTADLAAQACEFHGTANAALEPALSAANDVAGQLTAIKSNQSTAYSSLRLVAQDALAAWRSAEGTIAQVQSPPALEHARTLYLAACTAGAKAQYQLIDWIETGETTGFRGYLEQANECTALLQQANRELEELYGKTPVNPPE
jgi:hypothetical protein